MPLGAVAARGVCDGSRGWLSRGANRQSGNLPSFEHSSKPGSLRSPDHCALVRAAAEPASLALPCLWFLPDFCGLSLAGW